MNYIYMVYVSHYIQNQKEFHSDIYLIPRISSKGLDVHAEIKHRTGRVKDSTAGMVLALYITNLDSIPGTIYGSGIAESDQ